METFKRCNFVLRQVYCDNVANFGMPVFADGEVVHGKVEVSQLVEGGYVAEFRESVRGQAQFVEVRHELDGPVDVPDVVAGEVYVGQLLPFLWTNNLS